MLQSSPTVMEVISPRSTALYQTPVRAPRVTLPTMRAPSAMYMVGSSNVSCFITGSFSADSQTLFSDELYRNMYFSTNSTLSTYMSGVSSFALPHAT